MYTLDADLTAIVALWMGGALLLLPLGALTVRFALIPLLEAWACVHQPWRDGRDASTRLAALEEQVRDLRAAADRRQAEYDLAGTAAH